MENLPDQPLSTPADEETRSVFKLQKPVRIVFTGYMGAGKSTIGRLLARALGFTLVDTDHLLAHKHQMPVNKMFENHGEEFFRQAEHDLLLDLLKLPNRVISTGGGTLIRNETLEPVLVAPATVLVYLRAPIETLYERVIFSHKIRPLMNVPNSEALFYERFKQRQAFYEQAHITVDSDRQKPDILVEELIEKLAAYYPQWDYKSQMAIGKMIEERRLADLEANRREQRPSYTPNPGQAVEVRSTSNLRPPDPSKPRYNQHGGREYWTM